MGACECSLRLYLWNHVPVHAWHRRLLLCVLAFCLRLLKRFVKFIYELNNLFHIVLEVVGLAAQSHEFPMHGARKQT